MDNDNQDRNLKFEEQITGVGLVRGHDLVEEMEQSYLDYAMSVIVARALPDVRDGLKPVHRRILYAMHRLGLKNSARYRKSATVVGSVIGNYHPHGDSAIYDSMVRMAQDFSMRYMLVDGQGNFGSMDGDNAAAMRYTEARMQKFAEELLVDLDKDTVEFRPNFDDTKKEPSVLPAALPNLLVNGSTGIAVGMATNIPPHNLSEVIDGLVLMIDNPEITGNDLVKVIKGPDFPTGGVIYDNGSVAQAYTTGKGGIVMRAVAEVIENKKGVQQIVITEIPYQVNKAALVTKIAELVKNKVITGVTDLRDESGRAGVKVVVELKKGAFAKKILNQLYKLTPMQTKFHINMLALVDGIQPRVLSLEGVLRHFLDHRRVVVRRRYQFDLRKAEAREHIVLGLKMALDQIDAVISTIRGSKTKEEALVNLVKKFKLSELQAKAILDMRLQTLAGLERQKIEDELAELGKQIAWLKNILSSDENILAEVRKELLELKDKYGDKRKTKVIKQASTSFEEEDLIPDQSVVITLTKGNYIKRMPVNIYRSQARGGVGKAGLSMKEEDLVEHLVHTSNHASLLFFTTAGRCFKLRAYEVPEASRIAKGQAVVNLVNLGPEEYISSMIALDKDQTSGYLFMCTTKGTVKKTDVAQYQNIRSNGLIAIKLEEGDLLRWVKLTSGNDDIIISTAKAKAIRFHESDVRPMGRATKGVRGIKLRPDNQVVGVDVVKGGEQLLVISAKGYGKITKESYFTPHRRGGIGIKAGVVNSKTGPIDDVRVIDPEKHEEVMIITKNGVVIRLKLDSISRLGRATQGVKIMRLKEGDRIASLALIDANKSDDSQDQEEGSNE
ncbi:DNA gyrase subunit A [Candidatus Saccharibacteria bacterium]|nr:DNA gyrase subunit A [Candidatus Saccharibacteria bacterium]